MSIGAVEIGLFLLVVVGTVVAVRRTGRRWLGVLPLFLLIAAAFSPADVLSTVLIAVPNALLCGVAVRLAQLANPNNSATSA